MCVSFINCSMQSFQKLTTHWRANGNNKKALHKYSSQDFAMGMKRTLFKGSLVFCSHSESICHSLGEIGSVLLC